MQGDDVQVAFDDHGLIGGPDRLARLVQPEEQAAFVEERRLGRVEELGNVVGIDDARPEARHPPAGIADRKHDAVPEAVVDAPAVALAHQPGLEQFLLAEAALFQVQQAASHDEGA